MTGRYILLCLALTFTAMLMPTRGVNPKREFRGAWINTVYRDEYRRNTAAQNKEYISTMLDKLQAAGVNVVLFQVRPSSDAFYPSRYEPWSRFITRDGKAPDPFWDPLQYIIEQAHARGMELHAWINPYRVTTSKNEKPAPRHIYYKHPERFVRYDGKLYFDPGQPENRRFIGDVIIDIVNRYDVDGIHFDDYFYPYPVAGKAFGDDASYARYGKGKKLGDWRRENVDLLIALVHDRLRHSKRPWVRFGISPFGIWRNECSDPRGSKTKGLQNYDDLYADVLLWAERGWIDYLLPQLYWELEHPKAAYLDLVGWWADNVHPQCQLYIGQDIDRTMQCPDIAPSHLPHQLDHKVRLTRESTAISGNCWWPGYSIIDNKNKCATLLADNLQATPALVPAYPRLSGKMPDEVTSARLDGDTLVWKFGKKRNRVDDAVKYVVYCLPAADANLIDDAAYIYAITPQCSVELKQPGIYTVTAIDHANNESRPARFIEYPAK